MDFKKVHTLVHAFEMGRYFRESELAEVFEIISREGGAQYLELSARLVFALELRRRYASIAAPAAHRFLDGKIKALWEEVLR